MTILKATRRQQRLTEELLNPANTTVMQAAQKAGYKAIGRNMYRKNTKEHIALLLDEAGVSKDKVRDYFKEVGALCLEKEDFTNALRAGEGIAKMYGHLKDQQPTQAVAVFTNIEADIEKVIATNDTPST